MALTALPGCALGSCRYVGRVGQVPDHGAAGVFSAGFPGGRQPGGFVPSCGPQRLEALEAFGTVGPARAEVRWLEELAVATPGHRSPGGLDLSLGAGKPFVDICPFFASPSCGNH